MGQIESGSGASDLIEEGVARSVLENNGMRVTVLPSLGGKIASIQLMPGGEELLQQPLQPYAPRTPYMSFDSSDASGWDECLPSVAACEVQTASGTASIPDHGDFWQTPWSISSQNGNELRMTADGFSLPLRFSRILRLSDTRLHVAYTLKNLSSNTVEYVWSAHPLFAVEKGDRIILPDSVREVTVEGSAQNRLGKRGTKQSWPNATLMNQEPWDLALAGEITDGIGDKLYTAAPQEGWCAIERKRLKRRIEIRFAPQELPCLGLWICYGGWPDNGVNRQQCVALEPCTADGDSLAMAAAQGRARRLAPNAEIHWSLELSVCSVL
jgi:galactose mutarotase-like enzyme